MRSIGRIILTTFVLAIIVVSTYSIALRLADPNKQIVDLCVHLEDIKGRPVQYATVVVIHLTEKGPVKLEEALAVHGIAHIELELPRKYVATIDGKDYYASVNLWIIAHTDEDPGKIKFGTWTFSVDPTWLKWPKDSVSVVIRLREVPRIKGAENKIGKCGGVMTVSNGQTPPPEPGYSETEDHWTKTVEYRTWDQIWESTEWPIGSKVRVQSKERYWDYQTGQNTSGWMDAGYTTVTLETNIYTSLKTGKYAWKVELRYRYIYCTYWVAPPIMAEKIYAADTTSDPYGHDTVCMGSWSGQLPGYDNYYWVEQDSTTEKPLTGGYNFLWSVSIGFEIDATGASVGVELGVSKEPAPQALLVITAGTWTSGYGVRVESEDGTFRRSYSNWAPKP